jgi:hypothetical protein
MTVAREIRVSPERLMGSRRAFAKISVLRSALDRTG